MVGIKDTHKSSRMFLQGTLVWGSFFKEKYDYDADDTAKRVWLERGIKVTELPFLHQRQRKS
jgi:hypothetical protein